MTLYRLLNTYKDTTSYDVVDYSVNDLNLISLKSCTYYNDKLPESFKLYIQVQNSTPDFIQNPLSLPIVSKRLLKVLTSLVGKDIQVLDAPIVDANTNNYIENYFILNVLKKVIAIDLKRSEYSSNIINSEKVILYINKYRFFDIPPDVHIFRPNEYIDDIFFSEMLFNKLSVHHFSGIGFFKEENDCE